MILASTNHKDLEILINTVSKALVLTYQNRGYIKLLNNRDNPDFFIATFLPFYLFAVGGHLAKKNEPKQI